MRRPIWPERIAVWVAVLMLALVAGLYAAGAVYTGRAASLKVSMPATMAKGGVLALTASGYSGQYDEVAWSSVQGAGSACEAPDVDTINMQTVAKQHAFAVKFTNVFGGPETLTVCVYLFSGGPHANYTKGHYIVKSGRVKFS